MYQVKVIFSSSSWKFVEDVYGSGKAAQWETEEAAQEFADKQMQCFGLTYKVVKL